TSHGPAVERAALVEQRGVRGVEVFRLALADDAAAEGDRPAAAVADREHHPAAETIVRGAAVVGDPAQPRLVEQRLGEIAAGAARPVHPSSRSTASRKTRLWARITKPIASPYAPHPKQWKKPCSSQT